MKKILVTLGPSSMNKSTVSSLTKLGVYLFRINLSHTPLNLVKENIKQIQSWTDVPICLDSEGAQLRNGLMQNDSVYFEENTRVIISNKPIIGNNEIISFNPISITIVFF